MIVRTVVFSLLIALVTSQKNLFDPEPGWENAKDSHDPKDLTSDLLTHAARLSDLDHFKATLDHIIPVRVPDTAAHRNVRDYIISEMERYNWDVWTDSFRDTTPLGEKNFHNIIATLNPHATRRLLIACHYDSKYFPGKNGKPKKFHVATDSAVPCTMMLNMAYVMYSDFMTAKKNPDVTLQFVFFDGEEAFVRWNADDSIYGARHLAAKWEDTKYPDTKTSTTNELDRIDLFVLLDLLGTWQPTIPNYFKKQTGKWYDQLVSIEKRLKDGRNLVKHKDNYFRQHPWYGANKVEDDHIPFLDRGVPILHIIPTPFPKEWHTLDDNKNALDWPTIDNFNKIFRVFVAEYLHLDLL